MLSQMDTAAAAVSMIILVVFLKSANAAISENDTLITQDHSEIYVGSQCFRVRGVPTLRLQCPPSQTGQQQLVHVKHTFYGVPATTGNGNNSCVYRENENHCVQLADLPPGNQCNGRPYCTVHVSNPYLMNCRQYAVYMQINYTCVPKADAIDVCSSKSLEMANGYIRSPSYPDAPLQNPPARRLCQCQLRAISVDQEPSSKIVTARILDLSLTTPGVTSSTQNDEEDAAVEDDDDEKSCRSNYLHVTGLERRCANHVTADFSEMTDIDVGGGETLIVEFQSDAGRHQLDRGFWMEFSSVQGNKIKVTCETLWSRPVSDIRDRQGYQWPRPVTQARSGGEREAVSSTLSPDNTRSRYGKKVINLGDWAPAADRPPTHTDSNVDDSGFRFQGVDVISAHPWIDWPDDDESIDEIGNSTAVPANRESSLNRIEEYRRPAPSANDRLRPEVDDDSVITRHRESIASGQPRGHFIDHSVQEDKSHTRWFDDLDDARKSSAAFIGDRSEVFENRDFSRARESLMYNVDEVQIVTGIVIGILILVAICIIIILVFRRK